MGYSPQDGNKRASWGEKVDQLTPELGFRINKINDKRRLVVYIARHFGLTPEVVKMRSMDILWNALYGLS